MDRREGQTGKEPSQVDKSKASLITILALSLIKPRILNPLEW